MANNILKQITVIDKTTGQPVTYDISDESSIKNPEQKEDGQALIYEAESDSWKAKTVETMNIKWGNIIGNISDQADLQTELEKHAKVFHASSGALTDSAIEDAARYLLNDSGQKMAFLYFGTKAKHNLYICHVIGTTFMANPICKNFNGDGYYFEQRMGAQVNRSTGKISGIQWYRDKDATLLLADGKNAMSADLNVGNHKVINLNTPTTDTDASTKKYVDDNFELSAKKNDAEFTSSVSLGRRSSTIGQGSATFGSTLEASGINSFSTGYASTAKGNYSQAEGYNATSTGDNSHSEGFTTTASGMNSHAEGAQTQSIGTNSHTEGYLSIARGNSAHAEGNNSVAQSDYSHAEGNDTLAYATASHSEGLGTEAKSANQHVQGKYNVEDTSGTFADIVGGGTSTTARKNISALDWNGNLKLKGNVYVNCSDNSTSGYTVDSCIKGTTTGTSTAYVLNDGSGASLQDGLTVKFKLHVDSGATPTLKVNSSEAKYIKVDSNTYMEEGKKAGTWLTAIYSSTLDFFVLTGSSKKFVPYFNIFSESSTFTVPYSGKYRIIAIGKGADGTYYVDDDDRYIPIQGGAGGGGYIEKNLSKSDSLSISIDSSASVSINSSILISATSGGKSSRKPYAGSVSGETGVVPFPSNSTQTNSISLPDTLPQSYLSSGGIGGYDTLNGGSGAYGGDGGAGGMAYSGYKSGGYYSGDFEGLSGGKGAGKGGSGYSYGSTSRGNGHCYGGGGGGGYGGGGGLTGTTSDAYGGRYIAGLPTGGSAAVIIERIE